MIGVSHHNKRQRKVAFAPCLSYDLHGANDDHLAKIDQWIRSFLLPETQTVSRIRSPVTFHKLVAVFVCLMLSSHAVANDRLPNVVVFLVDDLGWRDLGCYGSGFYETPHIDGFAKGAVRFTQSYAACHVCSPTRASIMTENTRPPQPDRLAAGTKGFSVSKAKERAGASESSVRGNHAH